ncbi:SMP-30/gluconolactonase/LRE family protein [Streptomyces spiralis]|uniref:SMP-30/gluconolactonase/LRE family protein n=1 Tax=Streptomyces spiralis TaxID=66376 RepID=UPI00368A5B43
MPNGPAFGPGGTTMYLADSALGTVYAHRVDPATGTLSDRRVFFRLAPGTGSPDGMTVDDEGRVWSALWGAGEIRCHAPDGTLLLTLAVPASQPTSVCLTGSELLVTTARYGMEAPGPRPAGRCGAVGPLPDHRAGGGRRTVMRRGPFRESGGAALKFINNGHR